MLTLHQNYLVNLPSLAPIDGKGPTFTCTRSSLATAMLRALEDFSVSQEAEVAANTPRFDGFLYIANQLDDPDDLTAVTWVKTNCSILKNATGYYGGANEAFTITDDATSGQHYVSQTHEHFGRERPPTGVIEGLYEIFIDPAQSTAEYASFSATASVNNTNNCFTVRLSDGVIVDIAEYYQVGGSMDSHMTYVMPNGWIYVTFSDYHGAGVPIITVGFNKTGVTATGAAYVGTGDTLVVQYPRSTQNLQGSQFSTPWIVEYPGFGNAKGWHPTRQFPNHTTLHNSIWKGFTVERGFPERPWYSDLYGWNPGTQTATAEAIPDPWSSTDYYNNMGELADGVKVRITGVDQQYFFGWQQFWYAAITVGSWHTVSVKIEDMDVRPSGAIIDISDLTNIVAGPTSAGIDDMDDEGYVTLAFQVASGDPDAYSNIWFGLGADGVNDTGTFTMSQPQINFGKYRVPFIPNDGTSYAHIMPSNKYGKVVNGLLLPAKGLHIERESTNLILNPMRHGTAPWVSHFGSAGDVASNYPSFYQINRAQRQFGSDPARGLLGCEQPVTLATSTEYTLVHTARVWTGYLFVGVLNHGSLDIGVRVGNEPGTDAALTVEEVGADVTSIKISRRGAGWDTIELTFTSDAVATTGDVSIYNPDNANTDLLANLPATGNYFYHMYTQLEVGKGTSVIGNEAAATRTRTADVISSTDVTWLGTTGTLVVQAEFGDDVLNKTVYSVHDTTANERITLATNGSGNLIFEIVDGGVTQVSIDCGVVTPGSYTVAVTFDGTDLTLAMDGAVIGTDSSYTWPTTTQINLGSDHTGANQLDGWIKSIWCDDELKDTEHLLNCSTNTLPYEDAFIVDLVTELVTPNDDIPVS